MPFLTKEKLAIGEAIHAMKWLDQHFKGWGLEEECAILENICSNYEKKEIQTNHNYLDLQYQLDGAESEIERLREEIKILKMGEKVANELILRGRVAEERIEELENEIERLRADLEQSERVIEARLDVIDQQAARIKELEGREEDLFTCYNCGKKVDDVEPGPILGEIHFDPGYPGGQYEPPEPAVAYFVCTCCLRAEGKIGPDARPKCDHAWQAAIEERGYQTCLKCGECRNIKDIPRTAPTWQITDERILAIENAISSCVLIERYTGQDLQHETAVLRTMLREG